MKTTSLWLEPLVLERESEVNDFWWRTEGLNRYLFIYSVYTEQDKYARAKMGKDSSRRCCCWTTLNIWCHFWFFSRIGWYADFNFTHKLLRRSSSTNWNHPLPAMYSKIKALPTTGCWERRCIVRNVLWSRLIHAQFIHIAGLHFEY